MKKAKTSIPANKKLLLSAETVRQLDNKELAKAAGGWPCDGTFASMKPTCAC